MSFIVLMNADKRGGQAGAVRAPFGLENRVQRLIEALAATDERLAEYAFLHGADLQQRAVAAAVEHGRARLEAARAQRVEDELQHERRALGEDAAAPERRAERKAPLRDIEVLA